MPYITPFNWCSSKHLERDLRCIFDPWSKPLKMQTQTILPNFYYLLNLTDTITDLKFCKFRNLMLGLHIELFYRSFNFPTLWFNCTIRIILSPIPFFIHVTFFTFFRATYFLRYQKLRTLMSSISSSNNFIISTDHCHRWFVMLIVISKIIFTLSLFTKCNRREGQSITIKD